VRNSPRGSHDRGAGQCHYSPGSPKGSEGIFQWAANDAAESQEMKKDSDVVSVGIFYPSDPLGHVPSGIDSFIKGILKFCPPGLRYTLVGASSDLKARPLRKEIKLPAGGGEARFIPLVGMDASGSRMRIPLTVKYVAALLRARRAGVLPLVDILDFHRIEPMALFGRDPRPKNVILHQDMSVVRDRDSDIGWRYLPAAYEHLERNLLRRADRIFCVRQSAVDRYCHQYPEVAPRIEFIPTWVDTQVFQPSKTQSDRAALRSLASSKLGLTGERNFVVFVGRLDRQKDPLLLIEAFRLAYARLRNLHLVMIGDGVLRTDVERAVAESDLVGRVSLLGALPAREIAEWLKASSVFALSSAYEGMPIAVLEALASGLPVASTDVGEVRRVVADGETGRVAAQRSAAALGDAISRAVSDLEDEELPGRCVGAIAKYTPDQVLSRIYENHRSQAAARSFAE
jgi:glycosyltransferase involved in cell wall biosynthesis